MLYLLLSALVVAADGLMKDWVTHSITLGGERDLIPGILGLTNLHNEGAAFSMFSSLQIPILILTFIFVGAVIWVLLTGRISGIMGKVTLALVLGGAVGNAVDRLTFGYVVDMFETLFVRFAVFNVADIFITCGGVLFCVYILISGSKADKEKKALDARLNSAMERLDDHR